MWVSRLFPSSLLDPSYGGTLGEKTIECNICMLVMVYMLCNLKNSSRNWTWFSSWRKFWRLKVFFAAAAPVVISDLQGPAIDLNSSKKTLIYNQITFLLPLFVSSFRFRKPWVSGKLVGMFSTLLLQNLQLSSPGMSVLPPLSSSNISISWLWNSLFSHLCHG